MDRLSFDFGLRLSGIINESQGTLLEHHCQNKICCQD